MTYRCLLIIMQQCADKFHLVKVEATMVHLYQQKLFKQKYNVVAH